MPLQDYRLRSRSVNSLNSDKYTPREFESASAKHLANELAERAARGQRWAAWHCIAVRLSDHHYQDHKEHVVRAWQLGIEKETYQKYRSMATEVVTQSSRELTVALLKHVAPPLCSFCAAFCGCGMCSLS